MNIRDPDEERGESDESDIQEKLVGKIKYTRRHKEFVKKQLEFCKNGFIPAEKIT